MIVIPLIAVPLAVVIQRLRIARLIFVPLLALSLIFAVAAVAQFGRLYPSDIQRIFGMRSTAPAFPALAGVQAAVSFTLAPNGTPAPQTGKLEGDPVVGREGRDEPGYVRFGPFVPLKDRRLFGYVLPRGRGVGPVEVVGILQVIERERALASKWSPAASSAVSRPQ